MSWSYVFLTALVMALAGGVLGMFEFGGRRFVNASQYDILCAIALFVIGFIVNTMFFAWGPPVFHAGGWQWWFIFNCLIVFFVSWGFDTLEGNKGKNFRSREAWRSLDVNWPSAATWISGLAIVIILFPVVFVGAGLFNPLGQERATQLANLVREVQPGAAKKYPQTDPDHIPIVHKSAAREKAERTLGSNDLGSYYNLGNGELQAYRSRLIYIFELVPDGFWTGKRVGWKVPNYMIVDAEDPAAAVQFSAPFDIKFYPGGTFGTNLERHIYGYSDYSRYFIDDLSIEVDDDTGHPFYTASLNQTEVRWEHSIPVKFITIDAVTGEIKEYRLKTATDPGNIPAWVDRVYSKGTATAMLNWWGEWGAGPEKAPYVLNMRTYNDRYKVAGEPNLVYTNEGPAWQVLMAKLNVDLSVQRSVQKLVLMDTRSNEIRVYDAPGVQIEDALYAHFLAKTGNTSQLVPAQAAVYEIYGQQVWVGGLIPHNNMDEGSQSSYNGVGILNAVTGNAQSAILGTGGKAEALNALSKQIAAAGQNTDPSQKVNEQQITGVIADIKQLQDAGSQRAVITLVGDTHVYSKVVSWGDKNSVDALLADPGDQVIIVFNDDQTQYLEAKSLTITARAGDPALQPIG